MRVTKRDGRLEDMKYDKIKARVSQECYGLDRRVDPDAVVQKVVAGIYDGIETTLLDELAAETAASMTGTHPDYSILGARIAITALHKETKDTFSEAVEQMYNYINPETGEKSPQVSDEVYRVVMENKDRIDGEIIDSRDTNFEWLGWRTLLRSYLIKQDKKPVERPQYMWMRVSLGIWGDNLDQAFKTYHLMSTHKMTHATPTLFNAGTPFPQLSSCHLLSVEDNNSSGNGDSIDGIFDTLKSAAILSKYAGGIGLSFTNVRSSDSYISSTNGNSNGIIPFLRIFNNMALAIDQGGGKRKGAVAIYLEPWHADIYDFINLKKNHGKEELRARDLFYGMWIPDLFMQLVESDGDWYLMDPHACPDLRDLYAEDFTKRYFEYVEQGKYHKKVKARDLWLEIMDAQVETGLPYILYKDAANVKSNQKNLGTLHNSNLCTEIMEFSGYDKFGKLHQAICNLASVSLHQFVKGGEYDHDALWSVVYQMTVNLNRVIDINFYPLEAGRYSNMMMRPIGLGVQGLADTFFKMKLNFDSPEALQLSTDISETMYNAAVTASMELAKKEGPYEMFEGSPISEGKFQFDLWGVTPESGRYDWDSLRKEVMEHGVRNSLLVAPMPTASTANIFGNVECFEPVTENAYIKRVLSGHILVVNKYLVKDLIRLGLWSDEVKDAIATANGSIQHIEGIPEDIKKLYRTSYEYSMKTVINMARARGAYVDQSMSMNLYVKNPSKKKLSSMHFYSWGGGVTKPYDDSLGFNWGETPQYALKTGSYYLRTPSPVDAVKFTISNNKPSHEMSDAEKALQDAMDNGYDVCESCSS